MPNQFNHPWNRNDLDYLKLQFHTKTYKEIGEKLGRSYSSVQSKIRNMKLNKRVNKYSINSLFFRTWSHEMAYVLGFITADGNVQQTKKGYHVDIACDDIDVIEKIKQHLNSSTPTRQKPRFNGKISYSLRFSDKSIYYDLLKLGITPRKSLTIKPPHIPSKYLWDYIRGFFDGDGCVYVNRKSKYPSKLHTLFYTGSLLLAQFLFKTIKNSLTDYKGHIITKGKNSYVLHFGQKHSRILFQKMYKTTNLFMDRKYKLFQEGLLTSNYGI